MHIHAYTHVYTYTHMCTTCSECVTDVCVGIKTHLCNIHTRPCTSAHDVMTHSYVWRDSFICVTWLFHMCIMTHSYAWHDSFMCGMTHSYVWHHSFICVTWLWGRHPGGVPIGLSKESWVSWDDRRVIVFYSILGNVGRVEELEVKNFANPQFLLNTISLTERSNRQPGSTA